jgi:hypothetical protein
MSTVNHSDMSAAELHTLIRWTVASSSARAALSLTSADIGKLCKQTDTSEFYLLVNNTGPSWLRIDQVTAALVLTALASAAGSVSVNSQKITNLATPTATTDACTKGYADGIVGGGVTESSLRSAAATLTAALAVNSQKITGLATPTASTDAATKGYADGVLTQTTLLAILAALTADPAYNSRKLTGVAAGVADTDVANYGQIKGILQGFRGGRTVTASDTAVLSDAGSLIVVNAAAGTAQTVPPNSSVAYPIWSVLSWLQTGAGAATITAGAGVTLTPVHGKTLVAGGQPSLVSAVKIATDTWIVYGDLA